MTKQFRAKELPAAFNTLDEFVGKHKPELVEQVVSSIEHAIRNNLSNVEVFSFKDTDYMVILNVSSFKENLDNIYKYYISTEQYEFCGRLVAVQNLLLTKDKPNEQKKRHKPKSPSKLKNKRHNTN